MKLSKSVQGLSFKQRLMLFGPAFIISIGYIDPGNYATNIQAGSLYGYNLLWVALAANIIAMFIQYLSAKLGIVTKINLVEHLRDDLGKKRYIYPYWIQAELVIIATDIAEFIGAAVGFKILLHIPLMLGMVITGILTVGMLCLDQYSKRTQKPMEIFTGFALFIIVICYIVELILTKYPHKEALLSGLLIPRFRNFNQIYFAAGILGATVMPHVIYLHSGLFKRYKNIDIKTHLRITKQDILVALSIAGFANIAMIIMAATVFHYSGYSSIADITTAYHTLIPILGGFAALIFAISLIASGISSSVVATLSGDLVMQGFTKKKFPVINRRLITMIPSFIIVGCHFSPTFILVLSQVILSFGIVFALVPLLKYTNNVNLMGSFVNPFYIKVIGWIIVAAVAILNVYIVITTI